MSPLMSANTNLAPSLSPPPPHTVCISCCHGYPNTANNTLIIMHMTTKSLYTIISYTHTHTHTRTQIYT